MSSPKNRIVRSDNMFAILEDISNFLSSQSFNEGDLIVFDDATNTVVVTTGAAAEADFLLGVSPVTVVSGKLKSPYTGTAVDASEKAGGVPGPRAGVTAKMKLKSGATFNPGDAVYLDAAGEAQTVQAAANGSSIGIYIGKTVTAGATSEGDVKLGARFRIGALQL